MKWACFGALVLALGGGCFAMGYSTVEQVTQATREYNNNVRWWRLDEAAVYVPAKERQRFIARRSELEDELEVADFEVASLQIDKKKETAVARVDYTWMLKREGLLRKTTTRQQWERQDGQWVVATEVRVKGAPLSIFDEPTKADK
jgi:hypothetical protein